MKQLLDIILILVLFCSPLWAEEYDIWELESKFISSKCMTQLVEFPGYKIVQPQPDQEDDEVVIDEEEEDYEVLTDEEQYPNAATEGEITLWVRSKAIAQNVNIAEDIDAIYREALEPIEGGEHDGPFLGQGQNYVFFNKRLNKYYCCFVEWDDRMVKWNRAEDTWNTRMFPGSLDFLDNIPRIYLTPLISIGKKVFLEADISVIIDGTAIPHYIDQKAKKPRKR